MVALEHNISQEGNMASSSASETQAKLFKQEKPMQEVLRRGKAMLLWRNINVLAPLLVGMTVIWFLFEIVEYNFRTLICHISITVMLVLFIWSTFAYILKGIFSGELSLQSFLSIIGSLYILSVIERYFGFVNWLHVGFLCLLMLPIVYKWHV